MTASQTSELSPILLADIERPSIADVGGKAASLVRLSQAGFRVPEGSRAASVLVLSVVGGAQADGRLVALRSSSRTSVDGYLPGAQDRGAAALLLR